MKLPNDSIGPTDLIAYRECPRRMSFGMRRHTDVAAQSDQRMPEAAVHGAVWSRGYGSAIHVAIAAIEDGFSIEDAIQIAWNEHGHALEPGDLDILRADLEIYVVRNEFPGTRTVLSEGEVRVPLLERDGKTVYFRTRIDRLLERLDAPGTFIHIDYKSSKWQKSETDVHEDLQLWMTNWAVHEFYPECSNLIQLYDQLKGGQVPTRKSADQRRQVFEFLVAQVTGVLDDDRVQDDGLLPWKFNDWCQWCPILETCDVTAWLTDWSLTKLLELAPQEKQGRKLVVELDESRLPEYAEAMPNVKKALGILKRFDESVKGLIREVPEDRRLELGYKLRPRSESVFTPEAKEQLHEQLGERFYEVAGVTKSSLQSTLSDEPDLLEWALSRAEERSGALSVVQVRGN